MSTPHISTLMEVVPEWIDDIGHLKIAVTSAPVVRASVAFCEQICLAAGASLLCLPHS